MPPQKSSKIKKKEWYQIIAPKMFNSAVIGETLITEPELMLGKPLKQSLMNLTNDMKKQNVTITFEVDSLEGDKGRAKVIGYKIVPSSVKRLVRRKSEKIDLSFTCETADNVFLRIKPIVVTRSTVGGAVATKLRKNLKAFLTQEVKKVKYEDLIKNLVDKKVQFSIKDFLKKTYPVKICEIKYLGIEPREKPQEAEASA